MGDFQGHPFRGNQYVSAGALRETEEGGVHFKTGVPVEFNYGHRSEHAPKPGPEDRFQQRVEPAGFYAVHLDTEGAVQHAQSLGLEVGKLRAKNPLVMAENTKPGGRIYDENSWKAELSRAYGGKTGRALSKAVVASGHDVIVTVTEKGNVGEVVSLASFQKGWTSPRKVR